jgi:tricorn protease
VACPGGPAGRRACFARPGARPGRADRSGPAGRRRDPASSAARPRLLYYDPVTAGYLRFPHLHDDLLTFVAEDDVWLAPVTGGRAWRLTADQAEPGYPRFSRDGSQIAWTSKRDGEPEIYLTGTEGGAGIRLTHWGDGATRTCGWTPDGDVLAVTAAGQPFSHYSWAHAVSPRLDGQRRLPYGPVSDIAVERDGVALLTGRLSREPAWWKRYRGGTAGRLWTSRPGQAADGQAADGQGFRRLLADVRGQFSSPMLVSGRLVFLSDHEGTGNLYSCVPDGSDVRRHTDHDGFYARNASTDGHRVVYHCAGDIWLLDDLAGVAQPVQISLGSAAAGRVPSLLSGADHLGSMSSDQTGRASAVEVRGTVHWLTHRDGPARALSVLPGARARLPQVLGSTGLVVWATDAGGTEALEVAAADGSGEAGQPRRLAAGQLGMIGDIAAAPDGSAVAVAARDGRLLVVDVGSGGVSELAASIDGPVSGLAWSPDSAWLAWSEPVKNPLRRIRMARLADRSVLDVTDGRFANADPAFTDDGKYLAFLSWRNFNPVYDAHVFDLSFPYGCRPYLVTLAAGTPSPFGPLAAGRPVGEAADSGASGTGPGPAAAGQDGEGQAGAAGTGSRAREVTVDAAGLAERIVPLPVPENRYSALRAVKGGLAWLRQPLTGTLDLSWGDEDETPRASLESFDLRKRKCTVLRDELDWFTVSGDGERMLVGDHGAVTVIPANRKADPDNDADQVKIDLSRARFLADPAELWAAAFAEAGRLVRHDYWVPDMADIDWDGVLAQYRPLIDKVSGPGDFTDLLWELLGELGTSHGYARRAPGGRGDSASPLGLLGADLERAPDGAWRVVRVLPGESSDPRARSPLTAPAVQVGPGDTILAVDGQPVGDAGPGPLLAGAAGRPVELTTAPAGGGERRAVVVPLKADRRLRYLDWVASRRAHVREASEGRLGYLHVPDMVGEGWADYHRDLRIEMAMDGLVVDLRSNSGGHTSQLVVEKLARRVVGWALPRGSRPDTYPHDAPRGPVVAVTDEFAGSDGDIVTAAIRLLDLGPVVGARTWGGVIGIDGYHELADGSAITIPRYSFWLGEFGWGVENYGVDPDVEVLCSPDEWAAGSDSQLDAAIRLALEALREHPPVQPPDPAQRPSRRRPPLPPRQPR